MTNWQPRPSDRVSGSGWVGTLISLSVLVAASGGFSSRVKAQEPESTLSEAEAEAAFADLLAQFQKEKTLQPWERMATVEKFAGAPCEKTVEFLTSLYREEQNAGIHIAASHALGSIGSEQAVETLITVALPLMQGDELALTEVERALIRPFSKDAQDWIVRNALTREVRQSPRTYAIVLKVIARQKTSARLRVLLSELPKAPPDVQVALLESMLDSPDDGVARSVASLARSKSPEVQIGVHEILAAADPQKYKSYFLRGIKSTNWELRALSVDVLSKVEDKTLLKQILPLLTDRDKRVQIAVVQALLHVGGTEVIEPLFQAIDGSDPRVQDDIADALARLTGQNFGPVSAQWESWWGVNKSKTADYKAMTTEEFAQLKEEDRLRSKTVYFGLRVVSNNLAFLSDTSESMGEEYTPKAEGKTTEDEASRKTVVVKKKTSKTSKKSDVTTKIDVSKKELAQVIQNLQDTQKLNIFGFNTLITDFVNSSIGIDQRRLVPMQAAVRARALQFVARSTPGGATNLFGVIQAAMEYPEVDTIYLLSDGAPTIGIVDHNELLAEVERLNRRRRVKINTISFNPKPEERQLLHALADRNFGVYVER